MQHNPILPRHSNPLQICVTARYLPLRHSQNLVTALDVSTRRRPQPSHKFVLFKFALYTPFLTVLSFYKSTKPALMATLLGMPSSTRGSIFCRLIWSSSQQSWCDTRALGMVLLLVSLGYTPSSLAFWPSLGFETSCRGCSSYTAQPASQCLHRSSVSRIGNAAARGAASYEQSFFWKRLTDRGDCCKAAECTIHVQHVKGARSQTRNSQTGITLQCTAYYNKEHSHQSTCSLYTGGNVADTGSLELPQWNPPAS